MSIKEKCDSWLKRNLVARLTQTLYSPLLKRTRIANYTALVHLSWHIAVKRPGARRRRECGTPRVPASTGNGAHSSNLPLCPAILLFFPFHFPVFRMLTLLREKIVAVKRDVPLLSILHRIFVFLWLPGVFQHLLYIVYFSVRKSCFFRFHCSLLDFPLFRIFHGGGSLFLVTV